MNNSKSISFNAISEAFNIVKERWQPFVMAGLVAGLTVAVLMGIFFVIMLGIGVLGGDRPVTGLLLFPIILLTYLVIFMVTGIFQAGMYNMALRAVRGETVEVADLFFAIKAPMPFLLAGLLVGLGTVIGCVFCYIPGVIFAGLSKFTMLYMIDQKMAPVDALKASIQTLKENWLMATLFFIVASLVGSLGTYACYIGIFFTMPIMFVAITLCYRDVVLKASESAPMREPAP